MTSVAIWIRKPGTDAESLHGRYYRTLTVVSGIKKAFTERPHVSGYPSLVSEISEKNILTYTETVLMFISRSLKILLLATVAIGLSACSTITEKAGDLMPKADIVDTAVAAGSFSTLVAAVEAAGLVDTLKGDGPFTVFAPTDDAFAALPEGTVASLLEEGNKDQLVAILTYHVVPGKVMAADLAGQAIEADTVNGKTLSVDGTDGVTVNGAMVTSADVEASNGVIHVIDTVLIP